MKHIFIPILFLMISTLINGQEDVKKAFDEGVQFLKNEKYEEAEKKFTEVIQKTNESEGLKISYIYKGFSLNGQKKYDSAIVCFDKAIEIDPLDPASYTDRAKTLTYKGDYEQAIIDFKMVLKFDSTGKQAEAASYFLGRIKMLQGKNADAIRHFDKLLELVPTDAEGYFLRGTAKSNIMEIDGSIQDYDLAIKYNPDYMEAYANRGVQKINKIPVNEKTGNKIDCLEDPCRDLLKAKRMGDSAVDDMIYLYCQKCK